ncbi:MAG: FAD synthetase family protein, partial [Cellulomonadaceae bacterium]|nr:FAD synthetase family protein [Cellulomonadaceae bacterium]
MASSDIPSDNIGGNGSVVTFGSFDGVHRGHQALLQEVVRIAKSRDLKSIAFTFDPHPALFHQARPGMQLLVGIDEKVAAIKACGIDEVEVIPYTAEFAAQSPEYFVRDYLNKRYRARVVVLGGDARFGRELSGDLTTLQELGPKYGFELVRFDDVKPAQGAKRWSSTTARAALNDGDMVLVAATLGRLHAI